VANTVEGELQRGERRLIRGVALHVAQLRHQALERLRIVHPSGIGNRALHALAKLRERPRGTPNSDHRDAQRSGFHKGIERGEHLLVREIACGTEEHQRI